MEVRPQIMINPLKQLRELVPINTFAGKPQSKSSRFLLSWHHFQGIFLIYRHATRSAKKVKGKRKAPWMEPINALACVAVMALTPARLRAERGRWWDISRPERAKRHMELNMIMKKVVLMGSSMCSCLSILECLLVCFEVLVHTHADTPPSINLPTPPSTKLDSAGITSLCWRPFLTH